MSDRLGSVVDASDRADLYDAAIELQLQMAADAVAAETVAADRWWLGPLTSCFDREALNVNVRL